MVNSHPCVVATILDSADIELFHHHGMFPWTALLSIINLKFTQPAELRADQNDSLWSGTSLRMFICGGEHPVRPFLEGHPLFTRDRKEWCLFSKLGQPIYEPPTLSLTSWKVEAKENVHRALSQTTTEGVRRILTLSQQKKPRVQKGQLICFPNRFS